jgi:hypothetical protein
MTRSPWCASPRSRGVSQEAPLVLERTFDPPTGLELAQSAWKAAVSRVQDAKRRGDTRGVGQATKEAHRYSSVAIRMEMGR